MSSKAEKNKKRGSVTVAIQSYKNPEMLRLCLKSVKEFCDEGIEKIIVSDGETQLETYLLMKNDFPDVTFIPHKENVGFGALVNSCIPKIDTKYVFFINADVILQKNSIKNILEYMDKNSSVGLCGPKQKNFNCVHENTKFRFYEPQTILYRRTFLKRFDFAKKHLDFFSMKDVSCKKKPCSVPWILGSAFFVRKEALDIVGGMDSRFFMYMEDVDLCRRMWKNNYRVKYVPQSEIFHFYGKGSAGGGVFNFLFNKLTLIHISSAIKYFSKYRGEKLPEVID